MATRKKNVSVAYGDFQVPKFGAIPGVCTILKHDGIHLLRVTAFTYKKSLVIYEMFKKLLYKYRAR